jgi:hypothetical protein
MSIMTKLAEIARQMLDAAFAHGDSFYKLSRGLRLEVNYHFPDEWAIWLWRANAYPSKTEIAVIRREFNVPEHATQETIADAIVLAWCEDGEVPDEKTAPPPSWVAKQLHLDFA